MFKRYRATVLFEAIIRRLSGFAHVMRGVATTIHLSGCLRFFANLYMLIGSILNTYVGWEVIAQAAEDALYKRELIESSSLAKKNLTTQGEQQPSDRAPISGQEYLR